jgi:hypothetical protein
MFGSDRSRPKDYERAVVVDAKVKENREDHSSEWKERSAQKRFDRADIVRDTNLSENPVNQDLYFGAQALK